MNATVESVPLSQLKPAPWNPRILKDARFQQLCRSLEADPDFLEQRPVLAQADGTVYGGNMRLRAAMHLGWATIPAILSDVPDHLAKERSLKDNNQFGDWQEQELAELLAELQAGGSDLELIGFSEEQLHSLLDSVGLNGEAPEDPGAQLDRAEELREKWQTETGQLWLIPSRATLGRDHRLFCGDSTSATDVARLMGGERAGMVLTDPPYGMDLDTDWSDVVGSLRSIGRQHQTRGNTYERVVGDDAPFDPAPIFEYFGTCPEMFLWGADYYAERILRRGEGSWLVWDKRKESQSDAIGSEFELCWSKARHKRRMLRHDWFGFLSSENGSDACNRQHPTQKPTTLFADIIQQWGSRGGIVVDLYLGSGTTAVAAEQTARLCYGLEISPKYVAVALERLAGLSLEPRLA